MPHLLCKSTKTILFRKKITDKLFCLWLLLFWKLLVFFGGDIPMVDFNGKT